MMYASVIQWIFYFFLYCFLGWIFESAVVSISQRRFVNRGFMKGPFLPIYGFGALTILIATLPVRACPAAVFAVGMLAATVLESGTGAAMERLFKVRYWDYSHRRFQLGGYICLRSSLAWGALSLLVDYCIHARIEALIARLPAFLPETIVYTVGIWFIYDFTTSFRSAFSLRQLLEKDEALHREIEALRAQISELEARYDQARDSVTERIDTLRDATEETISARLARLEMLPAKIRADLSARNARTQEALSDLRARLTAQTDLHRLLHRNPGATSRRYARSLREIRTALESAIQKNRHKNDPA